VRLEHLLSGGACTWALFIGVHMGVIMRSDFAGFLFATIFFVINWRRWFVRVLILVGFSSLLSRFFLLFIITLRFPGFARVSNLVL
jgi:signal transduction histidine kinase